MSGSGRETLPVVPEWWEALLDVREWLGGPPEYPGVVRRPPRMSLCGWEALPDVRVWSGGPPGCPRVVERTSRMARSGGRPLQISGSGQEVLLNVRK